MLVYWYGYNMQSCQSLGTSRRISDKARSLREPDMKLSKKVYLLRKHAPAEGGLERAGRSWKVTNSSNQSPRYQL